MEKSKWNGEGRMSFVSQEEKPLEGGVMKFAEFHEFAGEQIQAEVI